MAETDAVERVSEEVINCTLQKTAFFEHFLNQSHFVSCMMNISDKGKVLVQDKISKEINCHTLPKGG